MRTGHTRQTFRSVIRCLFLVASVPIKLGVQLDFWRRVWLAEALATKARNDENTKNGSGTHLVSCFRVFVTNVSSKWKRPP